MLIYDLEDRSEQPLEVLRAPFIPLNLVRGKATTVH